MFPSREELGRFASGTARRVGVLVWGAACLAVGGMFLLAALWMTVAAQFGPIAASLTLAALLFGVGLLLLARAPAMPPLPSPAERLRQSGIDRAPFRPSGQLPPLAEAFLFGIAVALQIRSHRS